MRPQLSVPLPRRWAEHGSLKSMGEQPYFSRLGSPFLGAGHPAVKVHVSYPILVIGVIAKGAAKAPSPGPHCLCMVVDRPVPPQSHQHRVDRDTKHPRSKSWAPALPVPPQQGCA